MHQVSAELRGNGPEKRVRLCRIEQPDLMATDLAALGRKSTRPPSACDIKWCLKQTPKSDISTDLESTELVASLHGNRSVIMDHEPVTAATRPGCGGGKGSPSKTRRRRGSCIQLDDLLPRGNKAPSFPQLSPALRAPGSLLRFGTGRRVRRHLVEGALNRQSRGSARPR